MNFIGALYERESCYDHCVWSVDIQLQLYVIFAALMAPLFGTLPGGSQLQVHLRMHLLAALSWCNHCFTAVQVTFLGGCPEKVVIPLFTSPHWYGPGLLLL